MKIGNIDGINTFKGYKNIISDGVNNSDGRFIYISAQLNNEGVHDLDNYNRILNTSTRFPQHNGSDILTCYYISNGGHERIAINSVPLPWGEELKYLEYKLPKNMYKHEETIALRAYTFLANLTARMMNNNLCEKDKDIAKVFKHTVDQFIKMGNSPESSEEIVKLSIEGNRFVDEFAQFINKRISKTMSVFFK